ncbi:hypothetical protein [Sphingomonas aliaeris]|uniref:hypothetical protein n=1 Tax=Sphingomonas aliaeris TaxID=2759526 RepID=UPI001CED6CE7|nr:hypothetical protein [Sphingomonas aliaeris]
MPLAPGRSKRQTITTILIACAVIVAAGLTAVAYRPGLMTWDAVRQYDQALSGQFDDWHPPAMEWLWRQFTPLFAGPGPMLALQLALFWGGILLLSLWALRRDRIGLAAAIVACGALPLAMALMGSVLKDCLMAGALLAASGLLVWRGETAAPRGQRWARWASCSSSPRRRCGSTLSLPGCRSSSLYCHAGAAGRRCIC